MIKISRMAFLLLVLSAVIFVTGCSSQPVKKDRYFWPQLPERPRIEWLKAYSSQLDFPKSGMQKFITAIAGDDQPIFFDKPIDIKSDGNGKVYISDTGVAGVFVYDLKNYDLHMLGREASFGMFRVPVGLAVDGDGNVYVADTEKGAIFVFNRDEKPLRVMDISKNITRAGGIAIDPARKKLYVVDSRGHKIGIFTLDGAFVSALGERGDLDGLFNFPVAVTVNSKGDIIVADAMNARIQIFDETGKFLRKFGNRGDGPSDFQIIKSVAVDSDDNIYVTEGKGHKLIIFSTNGDYLLTLGGLYSSITSGRVAPGGFVIPQGIHIDKNDNIFVVDQLNRRFQVFQYISDKFLKANPIPGFNE